MKSQSRARLLSLSAFFTALIFVFSAWLHIPVANGYVHLGDAFLYLAACLLPRPYSLSVAAAGAALADGLSGFALWVPASVLIKTLTVFCFRPGKEVLLCRRNRFALFPAGLLCVAGYYLYEVLLYGSLTAPLVAVPGNLLQSLCSSLLFLLSATCLRRIRI